MIKKTLKLMAYATITLVVIALTLINFNQVELRPDARYQGISLALKDQAVSPELERLIVRADTAYLDEPYLDKRALSELHRALEREDEAYLGGSSDEPARITAERREITEAQQTLIQQIYTGLKSKGCFDELGSRPKTGRSPMRLLTLSKLAQVAIQTQRAERSPDELVTQLLPLISGAREKITRCQHGLITHLISRIMYFGLQRVALPSLLDARLSPELRASLLQELRQTQDPKIERALQTALQSAVKVDHHQTLQLVAQLKLSDLQIPRSQELNALPLSAPFYDAELTRAWLDDLARARVWRLGQPISHQASPPLATDALLEESESDLWMFRYNSVGLLLTRILHVDPSSSHQNTARELCRFRVQLSRALRRLNLEDRLINPLTGAPLDPELESSCDMPNER